MKKSLEADRKISAAQFGDFGKSIQLNNSHIQENSESENKDTTQKRKTTNSSYVDTLPDPVRRKYRIYAYASTWFGCFTDVMLDSSAIIILYFVMLGASNTLTMLSTGMAGFCSMFLLIPSSGLVDKLGPKKIVAISCSLACFSYLLMSAAPFFGMDFAKYIVLSGCFLFYISRPLWTAAWYPILGDILKPSERGDFFGFMRFSYYILSGSVFCLIGIFMGSKPPLWFLQVVIGIAGLLSLGRFYYISKIGLDEHELGKYDLKHAFQISIQNAPLVGFAVYIGFLSLAFSAVLPLTLVYLKNGLHYGDNVVQILSTVGIAGSICGFFLFGKLVRRIGTRNLQFIIHTAYILIPLCLSFCREGLSYLTWIIALLLFAGNFSFASFGCVVSKEILALARPGNITMANAFTQTYQMIGTACGRTIASMLLGNGILAASWKFWHFSVSRFQTIYLFCASLSLFSLILLFSLPSVVPHHEDYYNP